MNNLTLSIWRTLYRRSGFILNGDDFSVFYMPRWLILKIRIEERARKTFKPVIEFWKGLNDVYGR